MISAKSPQEAVRVLADYGYPVEDTCRGGDLTQLDALLNQALSGAYREVISLLPDPRALDTLLLVYDYHNLKALIKAEMAGTDAKDALVDAGTRAPEQWMRILEERDFVTLSFIMKSAIEYALESFAKSRDPQHIDFILDRGCYIEMKETAAKTGCKFLMDYVTLLIDSVNLRTFARIREMKGDWVAFNRVFLPGGSIAESIFVNGFDEDYTHFAEKLLPYHTFEDVMVRGGTQLSETGRFTELERLCDDAILEFATKAKYVPYGLDVPAAYLIAKESEIRLVRIITAALMQNLGADQLNGRIRRTYV
jgi:V/A-type H+-transporting ATPase subunit C